MKDMSRSKESLIEELNQLRKRNSELEISVKEKISRDSSEGKTEGISLQSIVDSLPVGLWITDQNGNILKINQNAKKMWEGTPSEAKEPYESDGGAFALLSDKISAKDMPMGKALKGEIVKEVAADYERLDGTRATQLISTSPLRNAKGEIIGCLGIGQDITKQKRTQRKIQQSEERFRSLVVASSDVVYRMSPDWSEMLQLHGKDFIKDTLNPDEKWEDAYIYPDDQPTVMQAIEEAIRTKSIFELEHRVRRVDGKVGWTHSRAVPIVDERDEIIEWFGTARDVTMLKKARELQVTNEALKQSIEMKDEFLSLISHEFRTPINLINTAIQALNAIYAEEMTENFKKYIGIIRQNNFRQLRLVNNLLDITRAQSGTIKVDKRNLDIVFLSERITESVEHYASRKGIELTFDSSVKEKVIGMDDEKYERILLNLLSNAIKFTPEGKKISVLLTTGADHVFVEVKDQGIGIPQGKREVIFNKFGQVDSSLSRQAEGTGIGLSLVNKFVKALEGRISVESDVGLGSTFTVVFPDQPIDEAREEISMFDLMDNNRLVENIKVEFSDLYL